MRATERRFPFYCGYWEERPREFIAGPDQGGVGGISGLGRLLQRVSNTLHAGPASP